MLKSKLSKLALTLTAVLVVTAILPMSAFAANWNNRPYQVQARAQNYGNPYNYYAQANANNYYAQGNRGGCSNRNGYWNNNNRYRNVNAYYNNCNYSNWNHRRVSWRR